VSDVIEQRTKPWPTLEAPYARVETTAPVVVDVVCDRCGGSCVKEKTLATANTFADTLEVEKAVFVADWDYWSSQEGHSWKADLCEPCAAEVKAFIDAGAGPGVQERQS
jgi:hypothetical protein